MDYSLERGHGLVYQERIAVSSMSPDYAKQVVQRARARQIKLMDRRAAEIDQGAEMDQCIPDT